MKSNFKILKNIELKKYSTFYVGGVCKYFIEINSKEDITQSFDFINLKIKEKEMDDFYVLGGGSNTIFSNNLSNTCILKINIKNNGEDKKSDFKVNILSNNIFLTASAGCEWDDLVSFACDHNYYGLENLSLIPGSVGASPIQNIGAYGVEVKDLISIIEVYNIEKSIFEVLENKLLNEDPTQRENNLEFKYRDSLFKKNKNKYIIISVTFRLSNIKNKNINYARLSILESDTLKEIREKVISIRKSKLPDWKVTSNSGSFFKNPIISKKDLEYVLSKNKNLKYFEQENNKYKLSAAELIDSLNLKGYKIGDAKVSDNHALIIINENKKATFEDVIMLSDNIIEKVKRTYGIILEREVNML